MTDVGGVDVHQHLWPAALIDALRGRSAAPRIDGWTLKLDGEPDHTIDPADHDPQLRAGVAERDGLERVLVSISSPLGIESLPGDESAELLAAWHDGALELPEPFAAWAAATLAPIDAAALEQTLARGFVGLQLPATALLDESGYERVDSLLDLLEDIDKPLLIHPGPATPADRAVTAWWPAVVDYVGQMHAAWYAFRAIGRPRHPRLRVVFAMLAGLAPLHGERFHARAGERSVIDTDVYLETSSYGPRAIDAIVRVVGVDALLHGSDRPYAPPPESGLGEAADCALRIANPRRLFNPEGGVL